MNPRSFAPPPPLLLSVGFSTTVCSRSFAFCNKNQLFVADEPNRSKARLMLVNALNKTTRGAELKRREAPELGKVLLVNLTKI